MDVIVIRDLRVEALIGIYKRELHIAQTLSIDLDIGIPGDAFVYTLIERQSAAPIVCAADASGQLWLHFALDSGFEATTDVVFDDVVFVLRR